jgi:hypothetical protein
MELPCDPALPRGSVHPKAMKSAYQRGTCGLMLTTALFTIAKICNQLEFPLADEWIKKIQSHMYNGIVFSPKKDEILSFVTKRMELEDTMLHERSQPGTGGLCL